MIAAAEEFEDRKNMTLREITVDKNHKWSGKALSRISMQAGTLIDYGKERKRNGDTYGKYCGI